MKVILLEKYKKLGQVGEVINVKNGFARNYLIPNAKAVQATKSNVASFEAKKSEFIEQSNKKEEEAQKLAKKINDKIVAVIKQAGDDGRLYGAVNSSEITEGLNKVAGTEISRKQIILNYSIKIIGFYNIDIDLGEGVFAKILLNVARSEGEAEENAKKFKSGEAQLITANTDLVAKAVSNKTETVVKDQPKAEEQPAEKSPEEQPAV